MTLNVGIRPPAARPASRSRSLETFVAPETVAVIGASEAPGSIGRTVMGNLLWNPFGGTLFPINPNRTGVLGVRAYPNLAAVPLPVELAILATPAVTIPNLLQQCAQAEVKGVIILSDAFREGERERAELAAQIREQVHHGDMRVLGPNSRGVACSRSGFNATFAPRAIPPGGIGFITQSGSLLTALTGGSLPPSIGCSAFFSVGSMIDIGWSDCLDFLAEDPQTKLIGIYLERIDQTASFFAALRRAAQLKPVLVVHAGRAASAPATADEGEEAFRRCGVLRVDSIAELFSMAEIVARQPTPRGRRLAILSNARGPAVLAADALVAEGGEGAELAADTRAALTGLLPAHRCQRNLIDVGHDAQPQQFAQAVAAAVRDPNNDALLVILTPQAEGDPEGVAQALVPVARASSKPILVSWLWGAASPATLATLNEAGIPNFACPNAAVRAFGYLYRHGENRRRLEEPVN